MGAYVIDSRLFKDQFSTEAMRAIFSDENTVQKWLDVEAALAKVQAALGIIPEAAAAEIRRTALVSLIDLDALKLEMDRTAHPIVPLLRAIKKVCKGDAGEYVHWGATTQDIIDTGTVLQVREALEVMEGELRELHALLSGLAAKYKAQPMTGRTHGQQALPITFGFKVAVWVAEIGRNLQRIHDMRPRVLVGQFSGAVGTLAALGDQGIPVQENLMRELGLGCPEIAWHTARDGIAELASVIAICTTTVGKIAHEIYCLQKTEVGELEEPFAMGKVGSSTMPHKRNPPTCETVVAIAKIVRSTAPLAFDSMLAEHERDKIGLQVEREMIGRLCCLADAALKKILYVIRGLVVRPENMERNLHIQKGLLMSEAIMMRLGEKFGRQEAHEMVYEVCMGAFEKNIALKDALLAHKTIGASLSAAEIDAMLDPHGYVGLAETFVDRVTKKAIIK